MTWIFKPSVWKTGDGSVTELPKPIVDFGIADGWDMRRSKVPLADGESYDGQSKNGVIISLQGAIGFDTSGKYIGGQAMFQRYEVIRLKIDVSAEADKYEFFFFHDTVEPLYRKFKDCSTRSLEMHMGDDDSHLFEYTLVVIAEDPVIYSTAPGA